MISSGRSLSIAVAALAVAGCGGAGGRNSSPTASMPAEIASPTVSPTAAPTVVPTATPGPEPFLLNNLQPPEIGAFSVVGQTHGITEIRLTPDDERAVVISGDGTIGVWALESGFPFLTLCAIPGHTCDFELLDITEDARRALARSPLDEGYQIRLLDLTSGAQLAAYPMPDYDATMGLAFVPGGDRLATVSPSSGKTSVYMADTGKLQGTVDPDAGQISAVALTPDARYVILAPWQAAEGYEEVGFSEYAMASAYYGLEEPKGGELQVWDLETGRLAHTLQGHTAPVLDIYVTQDGSRAFSVALDGTLRAWDLTQGTELYSIETSMGPLSVGMRFSPSEALVMLHAVDEGGATSLEVRETASGNLLSTLELDPDAVQLGWPWALPIDEERAIGATADSDLVVWDLASGQELLRNDFGFAPDALAVTSDGTRAVVGDRFNNIEILDLSTLEVLSTLDGYSGHTEGVTSMALMPDGERLLTGSEDMSIRIWDIASGRQLAVLPAGDRVKQVAASPDGEMAAVVLRNGFEIWDLTSEGRLLSVNDSDVISVTFTRDGQSLLASDPWSEAESVKVFNPKTGKVERIVADQPSVYHTHQLLDGSALLVVKFDGIAVFDLETGEQLSEGEGIVDETFRGEPLSTVSRNGNRWAYAQYNDWTETSRLAVFDFKTLNQVFQVPEHIGRIGALALTPDGSKLLIGTFDAVTLWDVETGKELFVHPLRSTAGPLQDIQITPDGQQAVILTGFGSIVTPETGGLITVLDLSPWVDETE